MPGLYATKRVREGDNILDRINDDESYTYSPRQRIVRTRRTGWHTDVGHPRGLSSPPHHAGHIFAFSVPSQHVVLSLSVIGITDSLVREDLVCCDARDDEWTRVFGGQVRWVE